MTLSETAREVIALAEAIDNYWAVELPKRHPDYPILHVSEDSGPPPPEAAKLDALLKGLPSGDVFKLLTIMYLGRGDFGTNELRRNHKELKETFAKPEYAISQMIGKGPLAEYLAEGLAKLARSGLDVDRFNVRSARASR